MKYLQIINLQNPLNSKYLTKMVANWVWKTFAGPSSVASAYTQEALYFEHLYVP